MSDDHLSNEVSVSVEVLPNGLKAGAKLRTLSAVDRFVGSVIDRFTPKLERPAALARSNNAREVRVNDALTDKMIEMIHSDPAIAERALHQHLGSVGRRQENKEAVVTLALEDLSQSPPSEEQNHTGPESLDEAFLGRFERYAEDATSDQLRERWGRVLASEIRQPGTFSAKVMRTVDEMDSYTAALFERLCESRIGDSLPKAILPEIDYMDQTRLVSAGLIVEPGLGQFRIGSNGTDNAGVRLKLIAFANGTIGVVAEEGFAFPEAKNPPMQNHQGMPATPIWLLTDVGHAISSILPNNEAAAYDNLINAVAEYLKPTEIRDYRQIVGTDQISVARTISRPLEDPGPTV